MRSAPPTSNGMPHREVATCTEKHVLQATKRRKKIAGHTANTFIHTELERCFRIMWSVCKCFPEMGKIPNKIVLKSKEDRINKTVLEAFTMGKVYPKVCK